MTTRVNPPRHRQGASEYSPTLEQTAGSFQELLLLPPERAWAAVWEANRPDTAPDYDIVDALRAVESAARTRQPRKQSGSRLSRELALRLKEIVAWAPGWDGDHGRVISPAVAQRVEDLVLAALDAGIPEPEISVASDGSLAVDWHLPERVVGLFVDREGNLEPAAIMTQSDVREVPVSSDDELLSLLKASKVAPGRATA